MMTSNRSQLLELIQAKAISPEKIESVLRATGIRPNNVAWAVYIDQLLLWFGGLALSLSALFFFAFNWNELGRFNKFGMAELLIILAVAVYWWQAHNPLVAKISLLVASILLGVLLALYGQTYQTGADPWQLFFNWALLMLPWAIIGRFAAIWILWIGLLNLSIQLYDGPLGSVFQQVFFSDVGMLWLLFGFNALAFALWEGLATKLEWMAERWAVRLLAVAAGVPITWLAVLSIFDQTDAIAGITWCAGSALLAVVYQKVIKDLFMLAGLCLSGIGVVSCFFIEHIFNINSVDGFLILAVLIILLGGGAAMWLKHLHKEWHS